MLNTLTDMPVDVMLATVAKYALLVPHDTRTTNVLVGWVEPKIILQKPVPPFAAVKLVP